ncbi:MAG: UvrD-helicase domain-containing protein, partial [Oscillospiraceae bacterium]
DSLLAVTFTKDATNQMKTKLAAALEKKLEENPDSLWIQQQQDNLALAKINTINAFCLDIVKTNIHEFDLQSGIKILDEVDSDIIVNDAIDEAFEYFYENSSQIMNFLIDALTENNEDALKGIIKDIYFFLRSLPFPDNWCNNVVSSLRSDSGADEYIKIVTDSYIDIIDKALKNVEYAEYILGKLKKCDDRHRDMFEADKIIIMSLRKVLESRNWEEIYSAFSALDFGKSKISLKAADDEDQPIQNGYIDSLRKLRKKYKELTSGIVKDIGKIGIDITGGVRLSADIFEHLWHIFKKVQDFAWEMKVQKNALDFSDVEIMTVNLLTECTPDGIIRTSLAKEMVDNKEYQVILIDEFQDVNNLQELIFKAISDTDDLNVMGKNVFVVGDVKQSIYRFRQSNPLLFINAKKIAEDDSFDEIKSVKLKKNFRSRKNVLDFVNYTFSLLMSRQVGEIEYSDDEKLRLGSEYPDSDYVAEIMLVKDDEENADGEIPEYLGFEKEHYVIACKIREMINEGFPVFEIESGEYRPCRSSDFCVLSRGKDHNGKMAKALASVGLKAFSEETNGYLRSREIAVMVNFLKVIDNPMQDMALVSVMMSSVFGFTADEVSQLRMLCRNKSGKYIKRIYQVINSIGDEKDDSQEKIEIENLTLQEKCVKAVRCIKRLRFYSSGMSLEHLIRKIYDETDFFAVASAFENSKQKRANLRLLLELATSYENNSDGGVSGFIRYLESASEHGGDFKQAVTVTEGTDSVAVKTIHKSKGLEYPFVFLCGLSKQFNLRDESKRVLLNEKLGVSMKISNHEELSITEPITYAAMKKKSHNENLSEELRLLYVAMTRAKEKLFIVLNLKHGFYDDYKMIDKLAGDIFLAGGINSNMVSECRSYAQWIYMVLLCAKGNEKLLVETGIDRELPEMSLDSKLNITLCENIMVKNNGKSEFFNHRPSTEKVNELIEKYNYKYDSEEIYKPAKMTVTEIVRDEKEREYGDKNPEFYPQLPRLADEIGKLSNTEKGTYTHLFMELADYDNASRDVKAELERLHEQGFFSKKEKEGVYVEAVKHFFDSDLYKRMAVSEEIIREKRFLVAFSDLNLSEKYDYLKSSDGMLQGIADCIFKEGDSYILVDYKTDNFKSRAELMEYQTQLELYKAALDMLLDAPVKSCYIYSFKLCDGVEIPL